LLRGGTSHKRPKSVQFHIKNKLHISAHTGQRGTSVHTQLALVGRFVGFSCGLNEEKEGGLWAELLGLGCSGNLGNSSIVS
jgi:hypothetical protein